MEGLSCRVPTVCEYPEIEAALEPLVAMLKEAFDALASKKASKTLKQIIICQSVMQSLLQRVRENKPKCVALALKSNGITADTMAACFARQKVKQQRAKALYGQLIAACLTLYGKEAEDEAKVN